MADKITFSPKGFRAFSQAMGTPAEGQHVKLPDREGRLHEFVVHDGKLWHVKNDGEPAPE
jgi:hypothetical protein